MRDGRDGGTGFVGLLTILFIGLKLTGLIKWSWVWVLSPLWISLALIFLIAAVIILAAVLTTIIGKERK